MKIYSLADGAEVSGEERAETFRRDWEIRRREKGSEEWYTFATFDPGTHWTEIAQALEFFRKEHPGGQVEYAAFEITTRRIETRRKW